MEQNHKPEKEQFDDNGIKTIEWNEHIQRRPEMYIGQNGVGLKATNVLFSDFAQWRFAQLMSSIYYLEIV